MRRVWTWFLKFGGAAFFLAAFSFAVMTPQLFLRDPSLFANVLALLVLVVSPAFLGVLMIGQANSRSAPGGRWAFGDTLLDRFIAFLGSVGLIFCVIALYRVTGRTTHIVATGLLVWVGALYYYFQVLDGWSSLQPRTRARILETLGLIFYGVFRVVFEIVVNVIFLAATGGRSGLISFGGGKSGGGGSSGKW